MKIPRAPHPWTLSPRRAVAIQRELAPRVRVWKPRSPIRYVAGVDAAFSEREGLCLAAAVLWDVRDERVVEERTAERKLRFPYIPGFLSFREAPAVLAALRKLRAPVDAIMCDGQGLAHPRRFGLACHVGVICEIPTVGCAKSRLVGEYGAVGNKRGSRTPLCVGDEIVGTVLRTRDRVRPVFVSIGHKVDLATAEELVLACAVRYRLPEPTRLADRLVAREKRLRG